jgi:hypothetical protein
MLATDLNLPVDLSIETVPFVPVLIYRKGTVSLTEEMKTVLLTLQAVYKKEPAVHLRIKAFPEDGIDPAKQRELAHKRVATIEQFLLTVCMIPRDRIHSVVLSNSSREPRIKVSIFPENKAAMSKP